MIAARPTIESGGDLVLRDIRTTVEPIGQVSCAGLPIPVAEIFSGMLRPLQAAAQGLGQVVRVPLGPALSQGLTELGRPRPLQLAGRKACLDVHPTALVLAPPSAAADAAHTVSVRLGLDVEPRLNLGDCPSGGSPPLQSLPGAAVTLLRYRPGGEVTTVAGDATAVAPTGKVTGVA